MELERRKAEIIAALRDAHALSPKRKSAGWISSPFDEDAAWGETERGLTRFLAAEAERTAQAEAEPTAIELRQRRDRLARLSKSADALRSALAESLDDRLVVDALLSAAVAHTDWVDSGDGEPDVLDEFRAALGHLSRLTVWITEASECLRSAALGSPLARLMQSVTAAYTRHTGAKPAWSRPSDEHLSVSREAGGPYVRFICACARTAGLAYQPEAVVSALKRLRADPNAEWDRVVWSPPGEAEFGAHLDALDDMGRE
jgi:hypothetical protein